MEILFLHFLIIINCWQQIAVKKITVIALKRRRLEGKILGKYLENYGKLMKKFRMSGAGFSYLAFPVVSGMSKLCHAESIYT